MANKRIKRVIIAGAGFSAPAKLPIQSRIIDRMAEVPEMDFLTGKMPEESMTFLDAFITVGLFLLDNYAKKDYTEYRVKYQKLVDKDLAYRTFFGAQEIDFKSLWSEETSKTVRSVLEKVVSQGSGKNAGIEGYSIGGKTATSQTLPRGSGRYISSFLGFAPAENPTVLGLCIIHNPQGMYYGGIIAAPVIRSSGAFLKMYFHILESKKQLRRKPDKAESQHLINEKKSFILVRNYKKTKELKRCEDGVSCSDPCADLICDQPCIRTDCYPFFKKT